MNQFDATVMAWTNSFAAKSSVFDWFMALVQGNAVIKGAPLAMAFFYLWFLPGQDRSFSRSRLLALMVVSVISIFAGRVLAILLPYRLRPLHAEGLDLQLPISVTRAALDGWSSFPSDHAVFYASLVVGFWMINRSVGMLMALHALIVIGFARVYMLFHYPTDILAGALVGGGISLILLPGLATLLRRAQADWIIENYPQYAYPLIFLMLMQMATMFNSARDLVKAMVSLVT